MKPYRAITLALGSLLALSSSACLTVGDTTNPTDGSVQDRTMTGDANTDGTIPPDFATPPDFAMPPDFATPPDLKSADLTTPPDFTTPPDLTPPPPDLVPPPDLTPPPPDLTPPPPDLTPPPPDLAGQIPYANATQLCQYIIAGRADGVSISTQRYTGVPNQGSYHNPNPYGWTDNFTINQTLMNSAQTLADQIQAQPGSYQNRGIPFGPDSPYKVFYVDGTDEFNVNHSLESLNGPTYFWNEASTDWSGSSVSPITRGTSNGVSITGGSELMRRSLYRHDNEGDGNNKVGGKIGCGIATVGAGQARWLVVMIRP